MDTSLAELSFGLRAHALKVLAEFIHDRKKSGILSQAEAGRHFDQLAQLADLVDQQHEIDRQEEAARR